VLPHRDSESGETLPVAEKVSRFRGSGTIDGTGQVASIVMPRRCRRALNAPLGRFSLRSCPVRISGYQKEHHPTGWCSFWRSRRDSNSRYAFGVHTISSRYSHFLLFLNTRYSSILLYFSKLLVYLVSS